MHCSNFPEQLPQDLAIFLGRCAPSLLLIHEEFWAPAPWEVACGWRREKKGLARLGQLAWPLVD